MSKAPSRPVTAWQLEKSVSAWQQLQEKLTDDASLAYDEEVVARPASEDVPPPHVLLTRLIDDAIWTDRRIEEADNLRKRYTSRRDRYQARADSIRATITELLDVLDLKAWEGNEGTAAMRPRRPKVEITDIDKLADEFVKIEKTAKKTEIGAKLKAGVPVEGAELSNPGLGLTIVPY